MAETTEQYKARIAQIKSSIVNEPYIKKMRDDIAEGISKTGNRQADLENDHEAFKSDLGTQFKNVIDESTGKDVISAPEIIAARKNEASLNDRLTKNEQETTAQLAQTDLHVASSLSTYPELLITDSFDTLGYVNEDITSTDSAETHKHVAFPTAAVNNSELLVVYRRGKTHISTGGTQDNGYLVQKKSLDEGVTWLSEKIILSKMANVDYRDPNIIQITPTQLLLIIPAVGLTGTGGIQSVENEIHISDNFGETWVKIGVLPKKQNGNYYHIVRGSSVKLLNGRLLLPVWSASLSTGLTTVPYVVYSDDNGVSWNVGADIGNKPGTETSIALDSYGKLWSVIRNDPNTGIHNTNMYITNSNDGGDTWADNTILPVKGHSPDLLELSNGKVLLTWRNTDSTLNMPLPINKLNTTVNYTLLNNGNIASKVYTLYKSTSTDIGYPWAVKNSKYLFIFYYVFENLGDGYKGKLTFMKQSLTPINVYKLSNDVSFYKNNDDGYYLSGSPGITLKGQTYVSGDSSNKKTKTVTLPENGNIRYVSLTVNSSSAAFIATTSNYTTNSFDINLRNIDGVFSAGILVNFEVIYDKTTLLKINY